MLGMLVFFGSQFGWILFWWTQAVICIQTKNIVCFLWIFQHFFHSFLMEVFRSASEDSFLLVGSWGAIFGWQELGVQPTAEYVSQFLPHSIHFQLAVLPNYQLQPFMTVSPGLWAWFFMRRMWILIYSIGIEMEAPQRYRIEVLGTS